jgi:hypothetical protein
LKAHGRQTFGAICIGMEMPMRNAKAAVDKNVQMAFPFFPFILTIQPNENYRQERRRRRRMESC